VTASGPLVPVDGRVTVVGGGVAGASTCAALRALGHRGPIRLLEAGALVHDRPPLSKDYLAGRSDEDGVRIYPAAWFGEHDVELLAGRRAVLLDAEAASVVHVDGVEGGGEGAGVRLDADAVVLALGATARPLEVPGGGRTRTLRTLEDARQLRRLLVPGARLVVCGAGLVGAEVTSTALGLGVEVVLVDPDPAPLAAVVGADAAAALHADHGRHGARTITDGVAELVADGAVTEVRLTGGERLRADVVLAATGAVAVDDLAREAGLEVVRDPSGGVVVDDHHRTSATAVLAVGDATRRRGTAPDGTSWTAASAGHWDAARLDGEAAAAVLLGQEPPARGAAWFWSDRHGRHVEVVGTPGDGRATRTLRHGTPGPEPFAALAWHDGMLTGAVTVDQPLVARAARRLVDRRTVVDPDEVERLLAGPRPDLRALLRG
jgi:3-phenylpropionate/trans-cinnamate dioxygenase ferredoxin reductase component